MTLNVLLALARTDPALRRALGDAATGHYDLVAPPALRPLLAASLAATLAEETVGGTVLAVTATGREAEDLTAALSSLLEPNAVAHFPAWETLPHERLSPRSDTVGQRLAVLRRLAHPENPGEPNGPLAVVVAPIRSLLQPIVAGLGDLEPVRAHNRQACELDDMIAPLV